MDVTNIPIPISQFLIVFPLISALRYNDTCLPELGIQINKTLSKPWGTTDQLIRDIYVYFEELDGIRKDIKTGMEDGLDPKTDLRDAFKKYVGVNITGGPTHLQSNIDITHLIEFYKWKKDNIDEFYELLQFTRKAWAKLNALLHEDKAQRPMLTLRDKIQKYMWEKDKPQSVEDDESTLFD